MYSPLQYLSIDYSFSQFWVSSKKLWSSKLLDYFPFLTLHATCVHFLCHHIFRYPEINFGSTNDFYIPWSFHRLLLGPKLTLGIGIMPSTRNLVLNFTLDCFGYNFFIQALFCAQTSSLEISPQALLFWKKKISEIDVHIVSCNFFYKNVV